MRFLRGIFPGLVFLLLQSCQHDLPEVADAGDGYPDEVGKIIQTRCAVEGCHNSASAAAAAGLDLSTWDKMFEGTSSGAVTIPFRGDFSTLLYFTNIDSTLGIVQQPTMPINEDPLSASDYALLRDWINAGAPNSEGLIKFSDDPNREKFYIVNQGCDVAHVFDAASGVAMRMIDVGQIPGASPPESPHNVRVTPDGKYWLVVFLNRDILQVFNTQNDSWVKDIPIGGGQAGAWNTLVISSDSKKAYSVDYNGGRVAFIDLVAGTSQTYGPFPITGNPSPNLHGVALNSSDDTLYVTCQELSSLLKIPVNDIINYEEVNLQGNQPLPFALKPHEIQFSPDFTHYFVTCQDTNVNQVRVYNRSNDQLVAAIPVGLVPLEMAVSTSRGLLFVSNSEDSYFPGIRGSVSVINMTTLNEVQRIQAGWQPHGIAVDEKKRRLYVANRNVSGGSAPHHSSACAGQNGYLSGFDLNSLLPLSSFRPELSVDPYSVSVRP